MKSLDGWDAAIETLDADGDPKPLAALLRLGVAVPQEVTLALAEWIDPQTSALNSRLVWSQKRAGSAAKALRSALRGVRVCMAIRNEINAGKSVEDAQRSVAAQFNMGFETVKKMWQATRGNWPALFQYKGKRSHARKR